MFYTLIELSTIKGSVLLDFYVENTIEGEDGKENFLDEDILDVELGTWKIYFDKAIKSIWEWDRNTLDHSRGSHIPLAIKLNFEATNNKAEYKACIVEMKALRELEVKEVEVFWYITLVIAQAQNLWKVKREHLKPYQ